MLQATRDVLATTEARAVEAEKQVVLLGRRIQELERAPSTLISFPKFTDSGITGQSPAGSKGQPATAVGSPASVVSSASAAPAAAVASEPATSTTSSAGSVFVSDCCRLLGVFAITGWSCNVWIFDGEAGAASTCRQGLSKIILFGFYDYSVPKMDWRFYSVARVRCEPDMVNLLD